MVIIFAAAAILTPPDPITQIGLALPLLLLYELSIVTVRLIEKRIMHNLKEIRKNIELFEKKIKERNSTVDLKSLIKHDKENRELIQRKEKLEQEKKLLSKKDPNNFDKSKNLTKSNKELENSQKTNTRKN